MGDKKITKKERKKLLIEIMKYDQELGLYDMDWDILDEKNKIKNKDD